MFPRIFLLGEQINLFKNPTKKYLFTKTGFNNIRGYRQKILKTFGLDSEAKTPILQKNLEQLQTVVYLEHE